MRFQPAFRPNTPQSIPLGMTDMVAPDFNRGSSGKTTRQSSVGTTDSFFHYPSVVPTELIDNELVANPRINSGATILAKPTAF